MSDLVVVYVIEKICEQTDLFDRPRFLRSEPSPQRSARWCYTAEYALSFGRKDDARNLAVRIAPRCRGHLRVTPIEVF